MLCTLIVACSPPTEEPPESQNVGSELQAEEAEHDQEHEEEHEAEHDQEHEEEHEAEHDEEHEEGDEHREHGAHEHGVAQLTIAWSGGEIAMDLETPAFNILGFENAPSTTAEQQLLDDSLTLLQEGNLLQILSPEAECAVTDAVVNTTLDEDSHEHDEEHDEEHEAEHEEEEGETHSDIEVAYNILCQNPENIEGLDAGELFAQFPNFEELQVQWISDTQQSAKVLTPDDSTVSLE